MWILSEFLSKLVELDIDVDCGVDKVVEILSAGAGAHQLRLDFRFETLFKHGYQGSVVPVGVGSELLELRSVVGGRLGLTNALNLASSNCWFVRDSEHGSDLVFE